MLGTDIGGLGTLIASMASLISYGFFVRRYPWLQGYYLKIFTLANLAFLVVLAGWRGEGNLVTGHRMEVNGRRKESGLRFCSGPNVSRVWLPSAVDC